MSLILGNLEFRDDGTTEYVKATGGKVEGDPLAGVRMEFNQFLATVSNDSYTMVAATSVKNPVRRSRRKGSCDWCIAWAKLPFTTNYRGKTHQFCTMECQDRFNIEKGLEIVATSRN